MERITRVAIKHNGLVYIGEENERHYHVIKKMVASGLKPPINRDQGFITNEPRFVNRKEAYEIAYKAGQIKWKPAIFEANQELFSEDVW